MTEIQNPKLLVIGYWSAGGGVIYPSTLLRVVSLSNRLIFVIWILLLKKDVPVIPHSYYLVSMD